jgi:hypothetical protein
MMGVLFILFWLSPQLAPILAILMISISAIVGKVQLSGNKDRARIVVCSPITFA